MNNEDAKPFTLQRAWDDLKYAVGLVVAVFGLPQEIAACKILLRRTRQEMLEWLAPVEALVRRILLLAALNAPAPAANVRARHTRETPVRSALRDAWRWELSENPADWRVLFGVWPHGPTRAPAIANAIPWPATPRPAADFNAYPLARRLEALLRVAENPAAAVARMARKLALRRAEAPRAFAPFRHPAGPVETILREAQEAVDATLEDTS